MAKTVREPLVHITRRANVSLFRSCIVRVIAVIAAMIVSGLLAFILIDKLRENPAKIINFYKCFIDGSFANSEITWKFLKNAAVLLIISLAITPAFKMRFWNIGAEGQTLVGVLGAISCAHYFGGKLENWALLIVMFVTAVVASSVWALIPAIFKTLWNTNETLFTLMMNYVATFTVSYFLLKWVPSGNALGIVNYGWLPKVWHPYFIVVLVAVLLAIALYIYFYFSKHGYEIAVVGESEKTARYIGINVTKVVIRTMILSGALCGLAGFLIGAGLDHSITAEAVGGQGFTAIMVSWLAKFNPLFMTLTSALVSFLSEGAQQISEVFDVQGAMPDIIVGVILFFIIGCEFFLNYKLHFRKFHKTKEVKKEGN